MTGPFPGIDPWLEAHWRDVHARFMVYACDQIADRLPADLQARIDEQLAVEYDDAWRTISPDIRVVKQPMTHRISPTTVTVSAAEPCLIPLSDEPSTHRHIEIIDRTSGERVVTAIELLSPANKVGKLGRDSYVKKQTEYLTSGVNLVEIDLIRAGRHIVAVPFDRLPPRIRGQGLVCVRRNTYQGAEVYGAPLREGLPTVRIPLRPEDPDLMLELQPVFDEIYRKGRYHQTDYSSPPVPRLSKSDTGWASERIREWSQSH